MLCVAQLIKSKNCCSPADGTEKPNTPLTNLETYGACVCLHYKPPVYKKCSIRSSRYFTFNVTWGESDIFSHSTDFYVVQ